jgi:hypothetical protein
VTNRALFYFVAQMRDGMFRERFTELGFDGDTGDVISIVVDGTPVQVDAAPAAGRMLLAQEDETEESGWRMWWAE